MPGHNGPRSAAIVGAGPAGLYLLGTLLDSDAFARLDVFDAVPAPFGLVRYGVAPDHPKTRGITRVLRNAFDDPRVRFLGNVRVGEDVTIEELRAAYDVVVISTGMRGDRRLGIPGEDLEGSVGASELVAWYTGHPDATPVRLPGAFSAAAVIGAGNVALDVARILAKPAETLRPTSMPRSVVDVLTTSTVTDVHIIARRGPAQARFTSPELREIGTLDDVDVVVDPDDLVLDAADEAEIAARRPAGVTVKVMNQWCERQPTGAARRVHFHFWRRPVRIEGDDHVTAIEIEPTRGEPSRSQSIPVQMVVRAIGYSGRAIPGLPYDETRGVVPSEDGRVVGDAGPLPGLYVTGWLRRGPTGVIGTNRPDAVQVAESILADLAELPGDEHDPAEIDNLLKSRGILVVGWPEWLRLEAHEQALGAEHGSDPIVVHELEAMLRHARGDA